MRPTGIPPSPNRFKRDQPITKKDINSKQNKADILEKAKSIKKEVDAKALSPFERINAIHLMCLKGGAEIIQKISGQPYNRDRDFEAMNHFAIKLIDEIENLDSAPPTTS